MWTNGTNASPVAPFTGAWIEIGLTTKHRLYFAASLPSRERGLKCQAATAKTKAEESLPSRERGLKSGNRRRINQGTRVAPFTGAWIEIENSHQG